MTCDDELHLLGTETSHLVPPSLIALVGVVSTNDTVLAFAAGIFSILLFGNMRTVETYRWRVDQAEEQQ